MENTKKHWRDVYDSEFLASWDLDQNAVLTIQKAVEQECKLAKGKEKKVVAHFAEPNLSNGVKAKPMILNATNCKMIQSQTGIQFFADWSGLRVEIAVMENKGGIGNANGLRIVRILQEVDISDILKSTDPKFINNESRRLLRSLTDEQKKQIREHKESLENV